MTSTRAGLRYEHELAQEIYEESDHRLVPIRPGWSGNSAVPAPDLIINDGRRVHAIELKKTSQDEFRISPDDISQLVQFSREYPAPTYPYIGIKFSHRQLVLSKVWMGSGDDLDTITENAAKLCPIDAHATKSNYLVIKKPDTNLWNSAKSGNDAEHVIETIGFNRPLSVDIQSFS